MFYNTKNLITPTKPLYITNQRLEKNKNLAKSYTIKMNRPTRHMGGRSKTRRSKTRRSKRYGGTYKRKYPSPMPPTKYRKTIRRKK